MGTALACHLARRGVRAELWVREPEVVQGINEDRRNPLFLSTRSDGAGPPGSGSLPLLISTIFLLVMSGAVSPTAGRRPRCCQT